jgi:hypothetical protein
MGIYDHLRDLHGLPAFDFPGPNAEPTDLPAPDAVAWRISSAIDEDSDEWGPEDWDDEWEAAFARFCSAVDTTRVRALIVGSWPEPWESSPDAAVSELLAARDRLRGLRALFLGDMTAYQCEISWIGQCDVTSLLSGFPDLEEFGVRGGAGLEFQAIRHDALRSLTVQSGGLDSGVVNGISSAELPALERLELWLGEPGHGGTCTVGNVIMFLHGTRRPRLRHLALRNSEFQDDIAAEVASASVVPRLEVLDLSMGTLGDEGATALLNGQPLTHLAKLDLHHHYISEPRQQRLRQALEPAGVTVNLDEGHASEDRDNRYVAVGE